MLAFKLGIAQQVKITYSADDRPLSVVLQEISKQYSIKFAFDFESFEKINATFHLKENSLSEFLAILNEEYFVEAKSIDGTWVLVQRKREINSAKEIEIVKKPQMVTISGYVKDKTTGENLMYCNVVYDVQKGAMTNPLGFFSFEIQKKDSVKILISHLGYKPMDTTVSTATTAFLYLEPLEILMKEIKVTQAEKRILEAAPQPDKIGFNPLKSTNIPRVSSDDLANALLLIPGVNFIQGGSSGLSVRGSNPTDNLILFDGIPVLETSHLLGNMSVLNAKYVQQVFVSRGGFDAEFGERAAGLIEITGKSGKNNQPYLDVSANLLNTNVLANIPVSDKLSLTAAWRRSFIDRWHNFLFMRFVDDNADNEVEQNTVTSNIFPEIKYQDVNAKLSFHPSEKLELNISFLYGDDNQSRDYELLQTRDYYRNEFMNSKNLGVAFNWNWQINSNWYHSFAAGYSQLNKQIVDETGELQEVTDTIPNPGQGKGKGKGLAKTKEKTYTREVFDIDDGKNSIDEYRVSWKTEIKTGNIVNKAGVGFTANQFSYRFYANRTLADIPIDSIENKATLNLINGFIQQNIQLEEHFKIRWGIRANANLNFDKFYFQPRGGIEYSPVPDLEFHYLSGIYHQFLSGVKRIDSEGHYNPVWYLPNESGVGVVRSVHHVLGTRVEKNGWLINAEAYYKNSKGKINLFAEPVTSGMNQFIAYIPKEGQEKTKGIDIFIQKKHGSVNHMIAYSLSKKEEQIENIFNNQWFPGYNDRLHRLKINEMIQWNNWNFTGSFMYNSGLPIINLTENNALVENKRSDTFVQLDFSVAKRIYTSHMLFNIGISFLNVLNRNNVVEVDYLRFASDAGAISVRSDISALSFTPVMFANIKIH